MEEFYKAGSTGLTYTHWEYMYIVRLYKSGMSIAGIGREYVKIRKGLNLGFAWIIVEHAVMRYLERLRFWTKERQA